MHLSPWLHVPSSNHLHLSPGCLPSVILVPAGHAAVGVWTPSRQCTCLHASPNLHFSVLQKPHATCGS
eukprot:3951185-Lingulodinium_polyedra.AAC.1